MTRPGPTLIIAAHPDDEVIGLGAHLYEGLLHDPYVLHVTDGAPRYLAQRQAVAQMRRQELHAAMDLCGVPWERCFGFGVTDQESALHMVSLIRRLDGLLRELRPAIVFTHPYEGGHPDHDTCAFVARCAVDRFPQTELFEFTSYHQGSAGGGQARLEAGEFLPARNCPPATLLLSDEGRAGKQKLLDCFTSQAEMLKQFPVEIERTRKAPRYDFTQPPHAGNLFYDEQKWGLPSVEWRSLAQAALSEISGRQKRPPDGLLVPSHPR